MLFLQIFKKKKISRVNKVRKTHWIKENSRAAQVFRIRRKKKDCEALMWYFQLNQLRTSSQKGQWTAHIAEFRKKREQRAADRERRQEPKRNSHQSLHTWK